MVTSNRRTSRLKLGQCERFEQALWRDDDLPHLVVDTREEPNRFGDVAWSPDDKMIASPTGGSSFDIGLLNRIDRERIPLALTRPLVLPVNLDEEEMWKDTLEITRTVNATLRDQSASPEAPIMFIDARDHPDVYWLRGRYTVVGDRVTMALKLFLRNETVSSFELSGHRSHIEALASELVTNMIGLVVEHFNRPQV